MSETSSSNKKNYSKNIPTKRNVSYSTDYHVNLLEASDKLVQIDDRIVYKKKEKDNISESEDMSSYINDNKKNTETYKNINNSDISNKDTQKKYSENNGIDANTIFSKHYEYKENKEINKNESKEEIQDENKNFLNEDYDNYNELSPENQMLKKLDMLRKLGELAQYGVKLSQNYNMNSDYFTMKYEYELHKNIRAKQNFINWTSSIMLNCIYGVEILNDKYDPFSLKLTGWSEQINADISSYYDIFGEIYEKYNKPGKSMSPELRIILMLGGSALKFHLNKIAISNRPNNNSSEQPIQDPRLLEQMRQQALIDRMREDSTKQNESLKKKIDEEHTLANQQMKDMLFLQQKQKEILEQEELNKKKMAEFERIRMLMEQNKQEPNNNIQNNMQNNNINTILNNAYGGGQRLNGPDLTNQRKIEITNQLNEMKQNINNIKIEEKSNKEENTDKSSSTSSDQNTNSTNSSSVKRRSKKEVDISLGDKSSNSKANLSTYSKRKYKRSGISIDTA